jgi:hypothetical protein
VDIKNAKNGAKTTKIRLNEGARRAGHARKAGARRRGRTRP